MEKNEIKKALYKQNPTAYFIGIKADGIRYHTDIDIGGSEQFIIRIAFIVPLNEIGDATFLKEMPAKLLIRYLI